MAWPHGHGSCSNQRSQVPLPHISSFRFSGFGFRFWGACQLSEHRRSVRRVAVEQSSDRRLVLHPGPTGVGKVASHIRRAATTLSVRAPTTRLWSLRESCCAAAAQCSAEQHSPSGDGSHIPAAQHAERRSAAPLLSLRLPNTDHRLPTAAGTAALQSPWPPGPRGQSGVRR